MPTTSKFRKRPNYQVLTFGKKYKTYDDFYDENKPIIYKSIINIFKEFKKSRKKILTLQLNAIIEGIDWETQLNFNKDEYIVLKRDLMPYFESVEDYEICGEINNLYKEFTN